MNKEEYFRISSEQGLPNRCPILNVCERRILTIYMYSDYYKSNRYSSAIECLVKNGEIPPDPQENLIPLQGEGVEILETDRSKMFCNGCPEVNLFSGGHTIPYAKGLACVSGSWDKDREGEKGVPLEFRHFSECTEFNFFQFGSHQNATAVNKQDRFTEFLIGDDFKNALKYLERTRGNELTVEDKETLTIFRHRITFLEKEFSKGLKTDKEYATERRKILVALMRFESNL